MMNKIALLFVISADVPDVVPVFHTQIPCPSVDYCHGPPNN